MKLIYKYIFTLCFVISVSLQVQAQDCCAKGKASDKDAKTSISKMLESNYSLVDHNGNQIELSEMIKGKVVVMNFIFTTCKTICPPMGANFSALKSKMMEKDHADLLMLSVSLDPKTDTPARLKAWKENFDDSNTNDWTLLTGEKAVVDQLFKDLGVFTPLIEEHAPILIMGSANDDKWLRTNGLASPDILADKINQYLEKSKEDKIAEADMGYFTDLEVINQHGEAFRFYSDLLKDKIVFINPFFSECPGTCPMMHTMMQDVQKHLGDKLGKSVVMLSISVDPVTDTPAVLKDYAASYGAQPGWHFLSGSVHNVNTIMKKLGKYVETREQHDTIILIGNMKTKLWKKANGLAKASEIIEVLDSVIHDEGPSD